MEKIECMLIAILNGVQTYAFDDARSYDVFEKYDNYRNERNHFVSIKFEKNKR